MNEPMEQKRNILLDQLSAAYSTDRISLEQYEALVESVASANTVTELNQIARETDLVPASSPRTPTHPSNESVSASDSKTTVAIFSGTELKGHFTAARHHHVMAVFGGVEIDLRHAVIPTDGTTIDVLAVFGGVDILVPPDINVTTSGIGVLGGFSSHDNKIPDPYAPTVHIRGIAVFGGVEVRIKTRK